MQFAVRPREKTMPGELGYAWMPLAIAAAGEAAEREHARGNRGLGQYWEAAQMAMEAMGDDGAAQTEQNPGMPGTEASVPRQPAALTTVSPTIQASISPQISPVMTQMQASPGASVTASPLQYQPGGQSAAGGGTGAGAASPYGGYAAPGLPSGAGAPMAPTQYRLDPMTGQYVPVSYAQAGGQYSPVSVGPSLMTQIPWLPVALVGAAGLGIYFFTRKKPRA